MKQQAKRIRTIYMLIALLAVLLPMSGWYARALTKPIANGVPLVLRAESLTPGMCLREAIYPTTLKVDANAVRR